MPARNTEIGEGHIQTGPTNKCTTGTQPDGYSKNRIGKHRELDGGRNTAPNLADVDVSRDASREDACGGRAGGEQVEAEAAGGLGPASSTEQVR